MSKKQLLNESEIRRFMKLANLEPLTNNIVKENYVDEMMGQDNKPKAAEYELEEVYGEDTPEGEEEMDLGDMGDGPSEPSDSDESLSPDQVEQAERVLKALFGKDIKIDQDDSGMGDEEPADEEGDEEPSDDEGEESEESDEEEVDEMEETFSPELQEALVQRILSRVTNRLVSEVSEAKKKGQKVLNGSKKLKEQEKKDAKKDAKKDDKKSGKKSVKDRMAALRAKKNGKVNEANAPAPKATNSNGPKKGAGSAAKGTWGVTSKVASQEWKAGKEGKGSQELETVSASADHIHSHGKDNMATKGKK